MFFIRFFYKDIANIRIYSFRRNLLTDIQHKYVKSAVDCKQKTGDAQPCVSPVGIIKNVCRRFSPPHLLTFSPSHVFLSVLDNDAFSVLAYALACQVVHRRVLVKLLFNGNVADAAGYSVDRINLAACRHLVCSAVIDKFAVDNYFVSNLDLVFSGKLLSVEIISTEDAKLAFFRLRVVDVVGRIAVTRRYLVNFCDYTFHINFGCKSFTCGYEVVCLCYGVRRLGSVAYVNAGSFGFCLSVDRVNFAALCNLVLVVVDRELAVNDNLVANGIDALVIIGGNGSLTGAMLFAREHDVCCIGLPGTIDNDLYGTDSTIGYDTTLNTIVECVDRIRDTAQSHERIFFIEVMGRDAGFLAQNSAIASGAEAAIIPEDSTDVDQLARFMERGIRKSKKSCIVIVSESPKCGALYYADRVRNEFPDYDVRVSILGHLQRGGRPSAHDRILASRTGVGAIDAILQGQRNVMVGVRNNEVVYVPLSEAVRSDKPFDKKLITVLDELSI